LPDPPDGGDVVVVPPPPLLQPQFTTAGLAPPLAQAAGEATTRIARLRADKRRRPTMGNPASNAGGSVSPKPFDVVKATLSLEILPFRPNRPLAPASKPS